MAACTKPRIMGLFTKTAKFTSKNTKKGRHLDIPPLMLAK
jgi:hypothetical protein